MCRAECLRLIDVMDVKKQTYPERYYNSPPGGLQPGMDWARGRDRSFPVASMDSSVGAGIQVVQQSASRDAKSSVD